MLTDLDKTQTKTTRYISRYLPVEKACQANLDDIEGSARKIFEPHFTQKDDQGQLIPRRVSKWYTYAEKVEFGSNEWAMLVCSCLQSSQLYKTRTYGCYQ